jgi:hypothetical protein
MLSRVTITSDGRTISGCLTVALTGPLRRRSKTIRASSRIRGNASRHRVAAAHSSRSPSSPFCATRPKPARDSSRGRHRPLEDDRADARLEAPDVLHRQPRTVGAAYQVDAVVAERRAHLVEIVDRCCSRVLGEVGVRGKCRPAFTYLLDRHEGLKVALRVLGWAVEPAVEGVRPAGAALIDEHERVTLPQLAVRD